MIGKDITVLSAHIASVNMYSCWPSRMTSTFLPKLPRPFLIERLIGWNPAAMWWAKALAALARVLVSNLIPLLTVLFRSRTSLIAENLFLRKQLAFYQEHKLKPQPRTI